MLGPHYVPYLGEVLAKIQWGYQFCLTEPTIIIDNDKSFYQKETDPTTAATDSKTIAAITPTTPPGGKRTETELNTAATALAVAAAVETASVTSSSSSLSTSLSTPDGGKHTQQQRRVLPEIDGFSSKPTRGHTFRNVPLPSCYSISMPIYRICWYHYLQHQYQHQHHQQ